MNKLLSIVIPTYNRKVELKCQLYRLLAEINKLHVLKKKNIEIIISDNCSDYDFVSFMSNISFELPKEILRFSQNKENVGFDRNIEKLYNEATGEYIWFLSDDDNFVCGAIDKILKTIENFKSTPSLIVLNNYENPRNNGEIIDVVPYSPIGIKVQVKVGFESKLETEEERLAILLMSGQISHCIVQKMQLELDSQNAYGGMHGQIANLALLQKPIYYITENGIISPGAKYDLSYWFIDSILFGTKKLFSLEVMNFSKALIDKLTVAHAKLMLNTLMNNNDCRHIEYLMNKKFELKLLNYLENTEGGKELFDVFVNKSNVSTQKSIFYCRIYRFLRWFKFYFKSKLCINITKGN